MLHPLPQVPEGGREGDELKVQHDGKEFVTTVPPGFRPGQTFKVTNLPIL